MKALNIFFNYFDLKLFPYLINYWYNYWQKRSFKNDSFWVFKTI